MVGKQISKASRAEVMKVVEEYYDEHPKTATFKGGEGAGVALYMTLKKKDTGKEPTKKQADQAITAMALQFRPGVIQPQNTRKDRKRKNVDEPNSRSKKEVAKYNAVNNFTEKSKASKRKWVQSEGGKAWNKAYYEKMKSLRLEARIAAAEDARQAASRLFGTGIPEEYSGPPPSWATCAYDLEKAKNWPWFHGTDMNPLDFDPVDGFDDIALRPSDSWRCAYEGVLTEAQLTARKAVFAGTSFDACIEFVLSHKSRHLKKIWVGMILPSSIYHTATSTSSESAAPASASAVTTVASPARDSDLSASSPRPTTPAPSAPKPRAPPSSKSTSSIDATPSTSGSAPKTVSISTRPSRLGSGCSLRGRLFVCVVVVVCVGSVVLWSSPPDLVEVSQRRKKRS